MSYDGHRITINGTNIPSELVAPGSYSFVPKKRIVSNWTDANLVEHHDVLTKSKAVITFSVRIRTLTDHETIKGIFANQEGITVGYWDDKTCTYQTGSFYMDDITFSHIHSQTNSLLYNATQIKLTEY